LKYQLFKPMINRVELHAGIYFDIFMLDKLKYKKL